MHLVMHNFKTNDRVQLRNDPSKEHGGKIDYLIKHDVVVKWDDGTVRTYSYNQLRHELVDAEEGENFFDVTIKLNVSGRDQQAVHDRIENWFTEKVGYGTVEIADVVRVPQ